MTKGMPGSASCADPVAVAPTVYLTQRELGAAAFPAALRALTSSGAGALIALTALSAVAAGADVTTDLLDTPGALR